MTKELVVGILIILAIVIYIISSKRNSSDRSVPGDEAVKEDLEKKSDSKPEIAMVMLNKLKPIEPKRVKSEMKALFNMDIEIENSKVFTINGIHIAISEIDAPIPKEELEFPIDTAWYWPEGKELINKHSSHLLVCALPGNKNNVIETSIALTMAVAAILNSTDSIGVYWGSASQVIQNTLFIDYAKGLNSNTLPTSAWVKTTGYKNNEDSYYIYTIGLTNFGLREFEIEEYKGKFSDGLFFLIGFIDYVMANGPVIKDGDTVGGSEKEKITVKYKKSSLNPEVDVISIQY